LINLKIICLEKKGTPSIERHIPITREIGKRSWDNVKQVGKSLKQLLNRIVMDLKGMNKFPTD